MRLLLLCLIVFLFSCSKTEEPTVKIAFNPWPGYELLYLAYNKNFYKKVGLNIELLQMGSLSDAQRAYLNGYADGLTGTVVESIQAHVLGSRPLQIVMVSDYSNGGDVIISRSDISSVSQLKGRRVGCEVSSLGIYILQQALETSGMTLADVEIVNVEQFDGASALEEERIDAFVTYPPVSLALLEQQRYHMIFSSADIPKQVLDVVSISQEVLQKQPELVEKLHSAWDMAHHYYQQHRREAVEIMARRENIDPLDFQRVLDEDVVVMDSTQQRALMGTDGFLQQNVRKVCESLVSINTIEVDCSDLHDIVYGF